MRVLRGVPNAGGILSRRLATCVGRRQRPRRVCSPCPAFDPLRTCRSAGPAAAALSTRRPRPPSAPMVASSRSAIVSAMSNSSTRELGGPAAVPRRPSHALHCGGDLQSQRAHDRGHERFRSCQRCACGRGRDPASAPLDPPVPFGLKATFSPDGTRLVVTSGGGGAVIYPISDDAVGGASSNSARKRTSPRSVRTGRCSLSAITTARCRSSTRARCGSSATASAHLRDHHESHVQRRRTAAARGGLHGGDAPRGRSPARPNRSADSGQHRATDPLRSARVRTGRQDDGASDTAGFDTLGPRRRTLGTCRVHARRT